MNGNWTFNELDKKIAAEIADFLPEKIFDSHAHLWRVKDMKSLETGIFNEGPDEATYDVWLKHTGRQVGKNRLFGGLFTGVPMGDIHKMKRKAGG